MSLAVSTPPRTAVPIDRTVEDIITTARAQQQTVGGRASFRSGLAVSVVAGVLLWMSFFPLNLSPLAWIAPVPLFLLVRLNQPTRRMYWGCYLGGLTCYLPALQWMRLGDPLMYPLWIALAAYLAVSFPITVAVARVAVHRWRVPLVVAAPAVWVGLEYARAHLATGFAWYFLGHTQYRWLELIQISDVVGAYGVSFVVALAAAALAGLIPEHWLRRLGLVPLRPGFSESRASRSAEGGDGLPSETHGMQPVGFGVLPSCVAPVFISLAVCVAVLLYGFVRRNQADFQPGPRVALIQGNFVASLRDPPEDYNKTYLTHLRLTALAVREQPDVIVWPEGMVRWPLTSAPPELSEEELQQRAPRVPASFWRATEVRDTLVSESQRTGAAMIFGLECVDLRDRIRQANSAVFVRPDTGLAGRYDKIHLVPFGEYMPFQKTLPWLMKLTPYPSDFGLTAGQQAAVFEYQNWRMSPIICFEDTVPHLVRRIVATDTDRPIDILVNLSNDGWFHGSSELDQHLVTAAFRAVECRVPVIRAVNTGSSAVIDGDGAILDAEVFIDGDNQGRTTSRDPKTGRWHKQLNAAVVQTVPLDSRGSLYVRFGDWFAGLCAAMTVFWAGSARFMRRRSLSQPRAEARPS
jgi:apolipoprotein N-acyltransferase